MAGRFRGATQNTMPNSPYPDTDFSDSYISFGREELPEPEPDTRVSSGRGILSSMMTWIRGVTTGAADVRAATTLSLTAGLPPKIASNKSAPFRPMPSTDAAGKFDSAELMRGIRAYHELHKARLYGDGLVIGLDTELPPPAFPSVAKLPGFTGALDTLSFLASDYHDIDAAHQAISDAQAKGINDIGTRSPRQIAWLINAACVRGALAMAPFAEGEPEFVVDPADVSIDERTVRAKFHSVVDGKPHVHDMAFGRMDNPMALGRGARAHIGSVCEYNFEAAANAVCEEFAKSFIKGARLTYGNHESTNPFDSSVQRSATFGLLKRSYVAFSNLPGVVRADKAFLPTLDRQAITDALRHSSSGFSLIAYLAHTDEDLKRDVATHRALGALALAHYSPTSLRALTAAHCPNGTKADGSQAAAFMRAFASRLGPAAQAALSAASPRYLSGLVLGSGKQMPLTSMHAMSETDGMTEIAGGRLGSALNQLIESWPGASKLPWAAVFSTEVAADLLSDGASDEGSIRGLVTLFEVANALRSKGAGHGELGKLPEAAYLLAAPDSNRVGSILQVIDRTPGNQVSLANRAMVSLVDELFRTLPAATSTSDVPYQELSTSMTWSPVMVAQIGAQYGDPAGQMTVALRGSGGGKNAWARVTLVSTSQPDDAGNAQLAFHVNAGNNVFTPLYDAKRKPAFNSDEMNLRVMSGPTMRYPTLREVKPCAAQPLPADLQANGAHVGAIRRAWTTHLATLTRSHPIQMASLFEPIAASLMTAGALTLAAIPPFGKKDAFRLARVCLARANACGMQLIVAHAMNPMARTAAGISLLDLALEAKSSSLAAAALAGLAAHPVLVNEPQLLTDLVQSSLGKLVERHPELLEVAVAHGAVMDEAATLAWAALHPTRISNEAQAAMTAAAMRGAITAAAGQEAPAADSDPTPRRRRMGV